MKCLIPTSKFVALTVFGVMFTVQGFALESAVAASESQAAGLEQLALGDVSSYGLIGAVLLLGLVGFRNWANRR